MSHSIGSGSFGRVVHAFDHVDRIDVAIKIVKAKSAFSKQALVEVKVLERLNRGNMSDDDGVPHSATRTSAATDDSNRARALRAGTTQNTVTMFGEHFRHCVRHRIIAMEALKKRSYGDS